MTPVLPGSRISMEELNPFHQSTAYLILGLLRNRDCFSSTPETISMLPVVKSARASLNSRRAGFTR